MLPLAPLSGFLITVWSWTIYSSVDPLMRYVIPALHSIQYLYFVWLMKRNEAREREGPPTFGRPVAVRARRSRACRRSGSAGFSSDGAPGVPRRPRSSRAREARAPTRSARRRSSPRSSSFVNIHHYFMDNVIWRRENPDTRYLQEPVTPPAE